MQRRMRKIQRVHYVPNEKDKENVPNRLACDQIFREETRPPPAPELIINTSLITLVIRFIILNF